MSQRAAGEWMNERPPTSMRRVHDVSFGNGLSRRNGFFHPEIRYFAGMTPLNRGPEAEAAGALWLLQEGNLCACMVAWMEDDFGRENFSFQGSDLFRK